MPHRTFRGKILYLHDEHGETGREWFTVTALDGREQTVRAMCEMDDLQLLRDVTFTVDAAFRPRDCFNRLVIADRFEGSSWFRFTDRMVECEGMLGNGTRIRQHIELQRPTPVFACHPLYCDGWHAAAYDHADPQRLQVLADCTNSSMKLDGSTAPMLGLVRKGLEYLGRETLRVRAGSFAADHFRIHPMREEAPHWTPLDFWVHGPDHVFLRLRWDMIRWTYELAEIEGALRGWGDAAGPG